MRTDAQVIDAGSDATLPWDFREWFDPDTLRGWVEEEIGTLDWSNPAVTAFLEQRPGFQPRALIGLLVYCYVTAVFDSDDVQRKGATEAEYRRIVGDRWRMDVTGVNRFRRENRGLLKWGLVQLFKRALRARFGEARLRAGLKRRLMDAAVMRLDLARQIDRGHDGL